MTTPNTTVPISCDPGICDAIAAEFVTGHAADGSAIHDPGFSTARAAFVQASEHAALLAQAAGDIERAGLKDPATRDRLRVAASKRMAAAGKTIGDAMDALASRADQVQTIINDEILGISATRTDFGENARAGEIRAYLRSLPEPARAEAVRRAVTGEKDRAVAAAVLSASPWASGLNAETAGFVRSDAERIFAEPQVRLRDSLSKLRALVATAGAALEREFGPLVGVGDSPAAKAARSLGALEGGA